MPRYSLRRRLHCYLLSITAHIISTSIRHSFHLLRQYPVSYRAIASIKHAHHSIVPSSIYTSILSILTPQQNVSHKPNSLFLHPLILLLLNLTQPPKLPITHPPRPNPPPPPQHPLRTRSLQPLPHPQPNIHLDPLLLLLNRLLHRRPLFLRRRKAHQTHPPLPRRRILGQQNHRRTRRQNGSEREKGDGKGETWMHGRSCV